MKKLWNNHIPLIFVLRTNILFLLTMSRQFGSLHRSISHPANLQNNIPIIPLFAFPPPQSPHLNTSSSVESDTNSNTTLYSTISQFNNPISKHPTNLTTLNPVHLHFPNLPFNPSIPKLKLNPLPLLLPFQLLHPHIPP